MRDDVLQSLARAGKTPDRQGSLRLYHATDEVSATAILREQSLRPVEPEDLAERLLQRGSGSVYLASSPEIGGDLGKRVVLAVDIDADTTSAEVVREGWGDPPRVDLEVRLGASEELALGS